MGAIRPTKCACTATTAERTSETNAQPPQGQRRTAQRNSARTRLVRLRGYDFMDGDIDRPAASYGGAKWLKPRWYLPSLTWK